MRTLLTIILCFSSAPILAQAEIDIGDSMGLVRLAAASEVRFAPKDELISAIAERRDWKLSGGEFRFGLQKNPLWVHFRLRNPSRDPATAFVSIPAPWLENLELFRRDAGVWTKQQTGYHIPYDRWDVRSYYPAFHILLDPLENVDFYLRVESAQVLSFPAFVLSRSEFRERDRGRTAVDGVAAGIFLTLLAVSGLLLLIDREKTHALYPAYLAFLASGIGATLGSGVELFASLGPEFLSRVGVGALLTARGVLLFLMAFLFRWNGITLSVAIWIGSTEMAIAALLAAAGWTVNPQIYAAAALVSTLVELALLGSQTTGFSLARLIWFVEALSRIPAYFFQFGLLPFASTTVYLWVFLIPLDFVILADRIRVLRRENENRYAKSRIAGLDVASVVERMEQILIQGQLLKDSTLRLPDLARALEIPPYQLSEILNNVIQKSFRAYVNGLRIRAAQDSLIADPEADIGTVMRDNGFRSRSVFNHAFKAQTGKTPLEFKRSQAKRTT